MSTEVCCRETSWTWSAQGATLLAADGDEVFTVDPFDASRTPLGSASRPSLGTERSISALAGSPDGSLVAFGDRSSVWTVPSDGGGDVTHVADVGGSVGTIDWSQDGTRLAVHVNRWVYTVDVADGDITAGFAEGSGGSKPAFPAWSPDGSRIAFVTTPKRRDDFVLEDWVANPDGSSAVRVFRDQKMGAIGPSLPCCPYGTSGPPVWSPDGSQIAFDALSLGLWFVVPADGSGAAEPFSAGEAEAWRIS
jgi:Tol biopolymer transport system component